jgi:colicin import membrane protein
MTVDIWQSLPAPAQPVEMPPPPAPVEEPPKFVEQPEPVEPPKAEIELAQKKKPKPAPPEPKKPVEVQKPVEVKPPQPDPQALAAQAELERARAAQAAAVAAVATEVGKYKGLIRSKIRRNIVMPPDVPDTAQAEFEVVLLPDGEVLSNPRLVKSSGSAAYDAAVERAILKAQPLPLPTDLNAKREFLNPNKLLLKVNPKE